MIAALASARALRFDVGREKLTRTLRPLLCRLLNESLLLARLIAACWVFVVVRLVIFVSLVLLCRHDELLHLLYVVLFVGGTVPLLLDTGARSGSLHPTSQNFIAVLEHHLTICRIKACRMSSLLVIA